MAEKLKDLLESVGYTGFANFDIKENADKPGDFRIFEINLRQGRSNFYMTTAGMNVAELATEVFTSDGYDCVRCEKETFWHHIPKNVVYGYTDDMALIRKAKALKAAGEEKSSLWYPKDMCKNPLRLICVLEQLRRQNKKYKVYCPKPNHK